MSPRRAPSCAVALALAVFPLACTYEDRPDDRAGAVDLFVVDRTDPPAGQVEVARNTPVDVYFNVAPAGEAVADVDLRIFSGLIENAGAVQVDLLWRRIRFTPFEPLRPRLRHQAYLFGGVRGINGATLARTVIFDFTTGEGLAPEPPPRPRRRATELQPLFTARCTSCHGGPEPRLGLDLSSPASVVASLRGIRAVGAPLLRVEPGRHATSFLLRKLLGQHVAGLPMPPTGPRLSDEELRQVADWVDSGAEP